MSYTFQGARIIAPVSFETDEILFVNNTLSVRQERVSLFGQRWRVTFEVAPSTNANILVHMLPRLTSTFEFNVPQPDNPSLNQSLTSTTTAQATAGTNGFQSGVTIPTGRFIRFATHDKVYMVLSSAAGVTTVYPGLEDTMPSGTSFNYGTNVNMRVFYDESQVRGITFENGRLSNPGTITLVENPTTVGSA
jgi:hypothetical protein